MKIDVKVLTGIFVGMVIALHYSEMLMTYLPLLMIVSLILVLKVIHR